MDAVLLVALVAAVGCALAGLLVPAVIARLPEPPPDPVLAELEAEALEGELTRRQQIRLDEGPKPLYVDVARARHLAAGASLASAVVAVVVVLAVGADLDLLVLLPVVPVAVLLAVVDWHTRLLPKRVVQAATVGALVVAAVLWPVTGDRDDLVRGVIGMVVAFVVFAVLWFVYPPGMGYGDVRLAGLCGLLLAHQGWAAWAVGLYSSFLLFGVPAVVLAVVRRDTDGLKRNVPFGPFLLLGVPAGLLVGGEVASRLVAG